jgi:hypothetical protein
MGAEGRAKVESEFDLVGGARSLLAEIDRRALVSRSGDT